MEILVSNPTQTIVSMKVRSFLNPKIFARTFKEIKTKAELCRPIQTDTMYEIEKLVLKCF